MPYWLHLALFWLKLVIHDDIKWRIGNTSLVDVSLSRVYGSIRKPRFQYRNMCFEGGEARFCSHWCCVNM